MMKAKKQAFGFLKKTRDYGLQFNTSKLAEKSLAFYSDAYFDGDKKDRRSRSGWLREFYEPLFVWSSRKRNCTSLSTSQAENITFCDACCEMKQTKRLLAKIGFEMDKRTQILCDNTGASGFANTIESAKRAKQMNLKKLFVKNIVESGYATISHAKPEDNEAKGFTKPLGTEKFEIFWNMIGLQHFGIERCLQGGDMPRSENTVTRYVINQTVALMNSAFGCEAATNE